MNDSLVLKGYYFSSNNIKYIEKDIDNVQIVVKHSKLYEVFIWESGDGLELDVNLDNQQFTKFLKLIIDGINHKIISNYKPQVEVIIYANKENIKIMEENYDKYFSEIYYYQNIVNDLENRNIELDEQLREEKENYLALEEENDLLKSTILEFGYEITYDSNGNISSISNESN